MIDDFDRKILYVLQRDASCSMQELGERVGLSHTPCWRRVKRLEQEGVIKSRVTLLQPEKVGMGVTVYAYITIKSHDEKSLNAFENGVQNIDQIIECRSTSGDKDYIVRVIVDSVEHYEKLLKRTLVHLPNVASINSTFALKEVKYTTAIPV